MTENNENNKTFSELRSLMNMPNLDSSQRKQLVELLHQGYQASLDLYHAEWLPYIQSFPHHFTQPLITYHKVQDLELAATIIPCAMFELSLYSDPLHPLDPLLQSPALAHISSLHIHNHPLQHLNLEHNKIGDQGALAIAASTTLQHLQYLNLDFNNIKHEALSLIQSQNLPQLRKLCLMLNKIPKKTQRVLQEQWRLQHRKGPLRL